MFTRLFGETEEDQFRYLQVKSIISAIALVIWIVGGLLAAATSQSVELFVGMYQVGTSLVAILCIVWGWRATLSLLGYGTIGALFSGNVAIGVVVLMLSFLLGCFVGLFIMIVGTLRYIYLLVKRLVAEKTE